LRGGVCVLRGARAACVSRGAGKKKSTDPPVQLLNLTPPHPPTDIFFLDFFLKYAFGRLSARGVQKHHPKKITKSPCRKKIKNFDKNFDVSFSSSFFFNRVFGCFSAMGVQKHYKKRFTKKIVSKSFYKKIDQKS
jgi:hypothetical protein